jgi:hypothetical protein
MSTAAAVHASYRWLFSDIIFIIGWSLLEIVSFDVIDIKFFSDLLTPVTNMLTSFCLRLRTALELVKCTTTVSDLKVLYIAPICTMFMS